MLLLKKAIHHFFCNFVAAIPILSFHIFEVLTDPMDEWPDRTETDDYSGPADYLSMSLECLKNQLSRDSRAIYSIL
jgi:hypothetical protein